MGPSAFTGVPFDLGAQSHLLLLVELKEVGLSV